MCMPEVTSADRKKAWFLKDGDTAIAYIDGVDWQHHLLADGRGTKVFPSVEDIEIHKSCVGECGIIEVEIRVRRWVKPQNMQGENS